MVNEDIAAVRAAFKWNEDEKAFTAEPQAVISLPVADLQRIKALADSGAIVRTGGFAFRMPSKSESLFWSKTELAEVHPHTEADEDIGVYVAMIGLAAKRLVQDAKGMTYKGTVYEACHFLDEICADSEVKEAVLDGLASLNQDQGTKFTLAGRDTSVLLDIAAEMSGSDYIQMWIDWRVDESCLFRTDPDERESDRKESIAEAIRMLVGAAVKMDETRNVSFIPKAD